MVGAAGGGFAPGFAAGRWEGRARLAPPHARPCHRLPARLAEPELSTEGGAEGREEAEGRGHLRSPNFLPASCSHFAPPRLEEVQGGGGAVSNEGKGIKSYGEPGGSYGRHRLLCLLRLAHSSSCHQHHGEKEKLRGSGAGKRPWYPSAHPDLPMEANQVRAACLGYSCNRVVGGRQAGQLLPSAG